MSISDLIVVMKDGKLQQIGKPQSVYDEPANFFVAKFLGTPAINTFEGEIKDGFLYIGEDRVLKAEGLTDRKVFVGIRPEGFVIDEKGPFKCELKAVEVMGRDTSVVSTHDGMLTSSSRSIIAAEDRPDANLKEISFSLKPSKVHLFDKETEERLLF